jgi:predicted nucleic acid-binding protein
MIVYFDSSALVKLYLTETASAQVEALLAEATVAGASLISRAEVAAALAKAMRMNWLTRDEAARALKVFQQQWSALFRLNIRETTVERAEGLAWELGLRGYDAVHLASALLWQQSISSPITLATFDRQLWEAAQLIGLEVWPEDLK